MQNGKRVGNKHFLIIFVTLKQMKKFSPRITQIFTERQAGTFNKTKPEN
jgi:hypothetical protein